jgi:hypothetical protein
VPNYDSELICLERARSLPKCCKARVSKLLSRFTTSPFYSDAVTVYVCKLRFNCESGGSSEPDDQRPLYSDFHIGVARGPQAICDERRERIGIKWNGLSRCDQWRCK